VPTRSTSVLRLGSRDGKDGVRPGAERVGDELADGEEAGEVRMGVENLDDDETRVGRGLLQPVQDDSVIENGSFSAVERPAIAGEMVLPIVQVFITGPLRVVRIVGARERPTMRNAKGVTVPVAAALDADETDDDLVTDGPVEVTHCTTRQPNS
jgi:hypothetical protein